MRTALIGLCVYCVGMSYASAQTLPFNIPNFCANPTITANGGAWSAPATWTPARVPQANDIVSIPADKTVTYAQQSDAELSCVGVHGTLTFSATVNTRLTTGNLMVFSGGTLQIGPEPADKTAEVVIANRALNSTTDPEQFGTAFLALGKVSIAGASKLAWTRLAVEPLKNATTLTLSEAPTGWQLGDLIVIPDTRQLTVPDYTPTYTWQGEERTISSIAGNVVTLNAALTYDHKGGYNASNAPTNPGGLATTPLGQPLLPHVGNLTRNVIIRSASPTGTRGHFLATARADVTIQYAAFNSLGRTTNDPLNSAVNNGSAWTLEDPTRAQNQIGRYPLHMHHLSGPTTPQSNGRQFTLIGNVVNDAPKWGLPVHNSHWGLVQHNIVYRANGSGLVTEDGSETQNIIDHNFALRTLGGKGGREGMGREGVGFWFRGTNNIVTNNVSANAWNVEGVAGAPDDDTTYGYKYFLEYVGNVRIPKFQGADTMNDANVTVVDGSSIPILRFSDNETYGAQQNGLTWWWIGANNDTAIANMGPSTIKNFTSWNVPRGIFHYQSSELTIDHLTHRCSAAAIATGQALGPLVGGDFGDYYGKDTSYTNPDIQGCLSGIGGSILSDGSVTTIQGGVLVNQVDLWTSTPYNVAADATVIKDRHFVVSGVRFVQLPQFNSDVIAAQIYRQFAPANDGQTHNYIKVDELTVSAFNGVSTDNFRVYYTQQAPDFIVPQTKLPSIIGAPAPNLMNAQAWAQYGIAVAGAVAPCATTRPEIVGAFACPTGSTIPAPRPAGTAVITQ